MSEGNLTVWDANRARDDALISAWVDDQLSEADRQAFEARMRREPDLQRRAEATRTLVQQARQLPQVSPPRNFIIQPSTTQQRAQSAVRAQMPQWQRALRWAAAVMSVMFVSLLVLDALQQPAPVPMSVVAPPAMLAMPSAAQPSALQAQETPLDEDDAMQDAVTEPPSARAFTAMEATAPQTEAPAPTLSPLRVGIGLALALAILLALLGWRR